MISRSPLSAETGHVEFAIQEPAGTKILEKSGFPDIMGTFLRQ